ncbi:MAG: tetratricopeptide repeat protein [Acidimicrobiales bacterium]
MIGRAGAVLGLVLVVTAPACSGGGDATGAAAVSPFVAVDRASASPTDRAIISAQDRLAIRGDDDSARLALALAFLQKAREVGDPTYYARADGLLEVAANGRESDPVVLVARGALALARHQFADALELGREAGRLAPGNQGALGVTVDALNELGRYDEALAATQAMADARPDLASLARVSYARELRGDLPGAVAAMTQAVQAGAGSGENLAYVEVQLGTLLLTSGDPAGAEAAYARAEQSFPGFAPAKAGRARVLVARGHPGPAADLLAEVVEQLPAAEHAIAHGEALAAAGRAADAAEAGALVGVIADLYRSNGVDVDLELALFAADTAPGDDAVDQARRAARRRPSVAGHDALAWSLFTNGETDRAAAEMARALALGSRDPQLRYHAAVIAMAQGNRDEAARHLGVVLTTNPRFSARHAAGVLTLAGRLGLTVPPPAG